MTIVDIATIAAIVFGPIVAVFLTRHLDNRRFKSDRRMEIFKDLMRTRRTRLSRDHVGALNLVEIEFHDVPKVIAAWQAHMKHLSDRTPRDGDQGAWDEWNRTGDRNLTKLLHALASELGFKIDGLDIFEGGYSPQGWTNIEDQQNMLRFLTLEVLKGNRALPVTNQVNPPPNSPYPPPPPAENEEPKKLEETK